MTAVWALMWALAGLAAGYTLRGVFIRPTPPAYCVDGDEHAVRVANTERPTRADIEAAAAEFGIRRVIDVTDGRFR